MILTASTLLFASLFAGQWIKPPSVSNEMEPSLAGATGWLNSKALNLHDLRGKVVLIDFWTYTCINWRRTLPYISEWASKYKDRGLVVIGIHTPEFSFEHNLKNVTTEVGEMKIEYPVALDNDFNIWKSFDNNYWPALYLIDAKGKLRYQKFGEGDYDQSERIIQQLLNEASGKKVSQELVSVTPDGYEVAADFENLQSPENYLGASRAQGFVSPEREHINKETVFTLPKMIRLNEWALSGSWTIQEENVLVKKEHGKLIYRFHARDVNLIMGPSAAGKSIKFRILIDGVSPGAAHGVDTDSNGNGTMTEQRMYQLIRQQNPIVDHEFQIEFEEPGAELYDFTFG